jgi:hypothetical protein
MSTPQSKKQVKPVSTKVPTPLEKKLAKAGAGLVIVLFATYGLHEFLVQSAQGTKIAVYNALTAVIMALLLYITFEK